MNCFYRAYIGAGSAIGANIGIDLVDISFRDSINGTFINAGAASSAVI
jgi:hypothetical protein